MARVDELRTHTTRTGVEAINAYRPQREHPGAERDELVDAYVEWRFNQHVQELERICQANMEALVPAYVAALPPMERPDADDE